MRRTTLYAALGAILALGATLYLARDAIAVSVFRAAAREATGNNAIPTLPDGLTAGFCGTGSPLPDRSRAGPCTAIVAGGRLFVFDVGDGAPETLATMGLPPAGIEGVFLTHFHSDHIDGLGGLAVQRWASASAKAPLPLYGGEGVQHIAAGFNEAYALDASHRVAHHGEEVVPPGGAGYTAHTFVLPAGGEAAVIYNANGVRILAFPADHGPVHPAFGYRVEYGGRSIVISGDTAPSQALVRAARGADLLIHEALAPRLVLIMEAEAREHARPSVAKIFHDILDYHTSPADAAKLATAAGVDALVLTHLIPPAPMSLLEVPFLSDARRRFNGPVWIARDGDLIVLPVSGGIQRRNGRL